jgi:hypothetical protein
MKRLLLVMPALASAAAAPVRAEDQGPKGLAVEIRHMAAGPKGDGPPPTSPDDERLRGRLSKSLRAAIAERNRLPWWFGAPLAGFDPLADARPPDVRDLGVAVESAEPDKTVVAARFDSGANARHVVRYVYIRENGVWRLDDISGENGLDKWSLRGLLERKAGE